MYKLLFSFISGLTISFISFKVLPFAFELSGVYLSTIFILLGIIFSTFWEYKLKLNKINIYNLNFVFSTVVILLSFFFHINGLLLSFCGGSLLYSATYCIMPITSNSYEYKLLMRLVAVLGVIIGIAIIM